MSRLTHICALLCILCSMLGAAATPAQGAAAGVRATTSTIIPTATPIPSGEGTLPPAPTLAPTAAPRPTRTPTPPLAVQTFAPVVDAYVRAGTYATTNYGAEPTLVVKDGRSAYDRRAFLRFDLRSVAAMRVGRATLKLYITDLPNGAPAPFRIAAVASDSWGEGMSWNSQPALGLAGMLYRVTSTGWFSLDLTGDTNTQLAGDKVVSVALFDDTAAERMLRVSSREGAHPPLLEISL
jgi:hypothetical protein